MYLNQLPDYLQKEAIEIAHDSNHEFNFIISKDPILDKLDSMDFSMDFERKCTQAFLGLPVELEGKKFKPITLLTWHVLWSIGSPIVKDDLKNASLEDLDIFFYLIDNKFDGDFNALKKKAAYYCLSKFDIDYFSKLPKVLMSLVRMAFHPLTFFPVMQHMEGKMNIMFDTAWMSSLTSIVHSQTGLSIEEILGKPLVFCYFYALQFAKQNGTKNLGRQPLEETLKMKAERLCELLTDWFIKRKLIKEDERQSVIDLMKVKRESDNG